MDGSHEHWLPQLIALASKYHAAACKFLQGHILDHIVERAHPRRGSPVSNRKTAARNRCGFPYSNPPLQQMPIRDKEIGPLIRRVFLPDEGTWAKPDVSSRNFGSWCD